MAKNEEQIQEQKLQEECAADEVRRPREPLRRRPAGVDHVVATKDTPQAGAVRGRYHLAIPPVDDVRPFGPESTLDIQQDTRVLDDMAGPSLVSESLIIPPS